MAAKAKSPKTILFLGVTGPSGIPVIRLALTRGHSIIVYARNPTKLPEDLSSTPGLKIIAGEITPEDVKSKLFPIIPTVDVVISYLGPTGFRQDPSVYSSFYRILIQHCRTLPKTPYFLILNTVSYSTPEDSFQLLPRLLVLAVKLAGNTIYREVQERAKLWIEEANGLSWTMFRVAMITDGPLLGDGARAGYVGDGNWKVSTSREDLAAWVVNEAEEMKWNGKLPAIFGGP